MQGSIQPQARRRRRIRVRPESCPLCQQGSEFYWICRCGFAMCQRCMDDNSWGLTCNGITWNCPDCGAANSYGNQ